MSTITGTITHGVTIASSGTYAYQSPLTILSGAIVSSGSGTAVYGPSGGSLLNEGYVSGYQTGVFIEGSAGSITNQGTIEGTGLQSGTFGTIGPGSGIYLTSGGFVENSGLIMAANTSAAGNAIAVIGGSGTVVNNSGTIDSFGDNGYGVDFLAGGSVTNNGTGYIGGGVYINGAAGSVVNFGAIEDAGAKGINLEDGGTVVDSGTIAGATAIAFGGAGSNLLELEGRYSITGGVVGSAGAANTLELSSTLGAVTASYNNLGLVNFKYVAFAAPTGGQDETLVISNTASLPGTIEGFTAFHDIIDLTSFAYHTGASATEGPDNKLTIVSGSDTLTLQLAGSYGAIQWQATPDGHVGTDIEPACFARGTLILTEHGERPVEDLGIGDRVMTLSGEAKRIKWIGRRAYDPRFVGLNRSILPVCIRRGALGGGLPRRDLFVSPEHALFIDGMLVPAKALVNGVSIVQEWRGDTIAYYHVELAEHDVIYAEGAAAESYIDCDNRGIFQNAHEFALLFPDGEVRPWAYCAPVIDSGPELDRLRRRIGEQGGSRAEEDGVWRGGAASPITASSTGAAPAKIIKLAAA
jgi:hypothetical protein